MSIKLNAAVRGLVAFLFVTVNSAVTLYLKSSVDWHVHWVNPPHTQLDLMFENSL